MLTADPVTEWDLELSAKRAMAEWLGMWFDGSAHLVPGRASAVAFPRASVGFDQGAPPQPMSASNGCEIRVIMHVGMNRNYAEDGGWSAFQTVRFDFWVRAALGGNADKGAGVLLAAEVAGLLFGILGNPDCHGDPDEDRPRAAELARLGITHLKPRPPSLVDMNAYACRMVTCTGLVLYRVSGSGESEEPTGTEPILSEQNVACIKDGPVCAGDYLLGHYRWADATRVNYASVHSRCSQGAPTVLTLEVDGVLTSHHLTIPEGGVDEECFTESELDVDIAAESELRWKVTSSPVASEDCPQVASVMMRVTPDVSSTGPLGLLNSEAVYFRSSPSFEGTLLCGAYAWSVAVTLTSAEVTGMASATQDTVYEMEVDGVGTGVEVTLPMGEGETTGVATFDQAVAAGGVIRWRVTSSSPDAEECATDVALTMRM